MPLLTELWKIRLRELQGFRAYGADCRTPLTVFRPGDLSSSLLVHQRTAMVIKRRAACA